MSEWVWDASFDLGIEEIDSQHRKIVDFLNTLDIAIKHDRQAEIGEVLKGMIDYTSEHFAFEEQLMAEADYPHLVGHRGVHKVFARRIRDFQERFENGAFDGRKLRSDLRIWLVTHIKNDDHHYAPIVLASLQEKARQQPRPRPGETRINPETGQKEVYMKGSGRMGMGWFEAPDDAVQDMGEAAVTASDARYRGGLR